MDVKTPVALIGAVVAAAGVVGLMVGMEVGWLSVGIVAVTVVVSYLIANYTVGKGFGEFMRGFLIGINAAMNWALGALVYGALFGTIAGQIVAAALGLMVLLSAIRYLSNASVYQGILGWLNWVLPMSWLVVGLGFVLFLVNLLLGLFVGRLGGKDYFKIKGMGGDVKTGTWFTKGGFVSNLNPIDTAFNMGNFSFVDKKTGTYHKDHEAGHTLNLAAFGSVFHFIGAVDENVTGGGVNAFSERLAESNDPATTLHGTILKMWV